MSLKGIINNVIATSTHIRTNAVKTSNTALQDQELLPAAQSGQTARKTGRENSTQIRPPETIRNRPQAGSIYNHDTAVNISRQSLLLIAQKKLELIPETKAVKCTPNPSEAVLSRETSIKPKTREKEQPKATPSN